MSFDRSSKMKRAVFSVVLLCAGCADAPYLTQDGQLAFTPGAKHGASVLTAHGVEFLDRAEEPRRVERHSVDDPWKPATGFLLPKDGVWRATSKPVSVNGEGLAVVVRSSDDLVPSWGGEVLLRIDALVPAAAFPQAQASVRAPIDLAIVVDAHGLNAPALAAAALDDVGQKDRAAIVDAAVGKTVLPLLPGTNRTLLGAAVDRIVAERSRPGDRARDLAGALRTARKMLVNEGGASRIALVITDGIGVAEARTDVAREASELAASGVRVVTIGSPDELGPDALAPLGPDVHAGVAWNARLDAVASAVPPPGDVVLEDVTLELDSVPAPAHIVESSGGEVASMIANDKLHLGDMYAGEARTEMLRVLLPPFVENEPMEINVTSRYVVSGLPGRRWATQTLKCSYSDDVERIAESRAGDVIAYGSALAMVRRLDRAFLGSSVDRLGGLRPVVAMQAQSLFALSQEQRDGALAQEAEVLEALLSTIDD